VFCLLVVLAKLSLLAKWLARKTPLRKPNRGEGIISIKPRPKSTLYCVGLLCLTAWYLCCSPALRDIHHTCMAWYSLFVLKVPLNNKQTNNSEDFESDVSDLITGSNVWLTLATLPGVLLTVFYCGLNWTCCYAYSHMLITCTCTYSWVASVLCSGLVAPPSCRFTGSDWLLHGHTLLTVPGENWG